MDKKCNIIVIGFGSIGKRHYQNLRALGYHNVSVYDIDTKTAGIGVRTLTSIGGNALKQFDIAFVCNPSNLHVRTALRCAKAGCHLFIEKPLSGTVAGIAELETVCRDKKLVRMVACNYLFHKGLAVMRRALKSGRYGKPVLSRVIAGYSIPVHRLYIYETLKKTGGAERLIMDSGSHLVNYLEFLLGPIKKYSARTGDVSTLGIRGEEAAALVFVHENGVLSTAAIDYVSRKRAHFIDIVTDKGTLTIDFMDDSVVFADERRIKVLYQGKKNTNQMFVDELKHFLQCVAHGKKPLQDIVGGKAVVKLLSTARGK